MNDDEDKEKMWKKLKEPTPLFYSIEGGWPHYASGKPIPLDEQQRLLDFENYVR